MSLLDKRELIKQKIVADHGCSGACIRCTKIQAMIDKMGDSNIPVGYWFLNMKEFRGPQQLLSITEEYIKDIEPNYLSGKSMCISGNQGIGKTLSAICILKAALKSNKSAYYITAADMMSEVADYENNGNIRKILRESDFLVIDELDSRFFTSNSVKEFFSSIYENIFRFRSHNTLPTILCTNETENILNVFSGQCVQSIKSLHTQYLNFYPMAGLDVRNTIGETCKKT
jgi:hypothetical protein